MPIRTEQQAVGGLSIQDILSDIGDSPFSTVDMIGLGTVLGITTGIGDGNNVVLPSDFYGEDINLTASSGTFGQASISKNNLGGTVNVSLNVNGNFKLTNVPAFVTATPVYGTAATTNIAFQFNDNNFLGASAFSSQTLNLVGSGNNVRDTLNISQAGNPILFDLNTAFTTANNYQAQTINNFAYIDSSDNLTVTIESQNTAVATVALNSTQTISGGTRYKYNVSFSQHFTESSRSSNIVFTGTASNGQTIEQSTLVTQPQYYKAKWSNSAVTLSDNGGTTNQPIVASAGWTISTAQSYSWIVNETGNSGTGNTTIEFTYSINNSGGERTATFTVTDSNTSDTYDIVFTQPPVELSEFSVTPSSLALSKTGAGLVNFSVAITANPGFNEYWEAQSTTTSTATIGPYSNGTYYDTDYLEHRLGTSGTWTSIRNKITGNGDEDLYIRNPNGAWLSFEDPMEFPSYRVRSRDYSSDYSVTRTITQPVAIASVDTYMAFGTTTSNAITAGGSGILDIYSNWNGLTLAVPPYFSFGGTYDANVSIKGNWEANYTDLTAGSWPSTGYAGSTSNWNTHSNTAQNNAGRTYRMQLNVKNHGTGNTQTPTSNQYITLNFYSNNSPTNIHFSRNVYVVLTDGGSGTTSTTFTGGTNPGRPGGGQSS